MTGSSRCRKETLRFNIDEGFHDRPESSNQPSVAHFLRDNPAVYNAGQGTRPSGTREIVLTAG
jgi:hypothetical protein